MMKEIIKKWSLLHVIKLLVGIILLFQSFTQKDITLAILSGFLLLTAITNVGCCGSNGCAVNFVNPKKENEL